MQHKNLNNFDIRAGELLLYYYHADKNLDTVWKNCLFIFN